LCYFLLSIYFIKKGINLFFKFFKELRNTIGNVPLEWYDDIEHMGYDLSGEKIIKPPKIKSDLLDEFIKKIENQDYM
jgi:hypothetical protein